MASDVDICNQALTKIGAERITDLADEGKNARTLNAIYTIKREALLAMHPWTFAIKRAEIPASSTAPAFEWAYQYPLPSDYLRLVQVGETWAFYSTDTGPAFQVEADSVNGRQAVLTDQASPLKIRYVYRVTNPGLFPAAFVEAFACYLATQIAEPITQNLSKRQQAWDEFKAAIKDAKRINAIEQPPQDTTMSSWERAMRGYTIY